MNTETNKELLRQILERTGKIEKELKCIGCILWAKNGDSEKKGLIEQVHDNTEHRTKQEKKWITFQTILAAQFVAFLFLLLQRVFS